MPKKKTTQSPKVRRIWAINPKTRIKKSKKLYDRKTAKQKKWGDEFLK